MDHRQFDAPAGGDGWRRRGDRVCVTREVFAQTQDDTLQAGARIIPECQ